MPLQLQPPPAQAVSNCILTCIHKVQQYCTKVLRLLGWGVWGELTGPSIRLCVSGTRAVCEGEPETTKKGAAAWPSSGRSAPQTVGWSPPANLFSPARPGPQRAAPCCRGAGVNLLVRGITLGDHHHANCYLRSIHLYHELTVGAWA